jgi:hypothetical protein
MTETAFVIGTGPSLNKIDMDKLKNYDCVTFNRAYVAFEDWGFAPRYYLAIDGHDIRSMYKDLGGIIKKYKDTEFFIREDEISNSHFPPSSFQDEDKKTSLFDWGEDNLYKLHYSAGSGFKGKGKSLSSWRDYDIPLHASPWETRSDGPGNPTEFKYVELPYYPNAGWMGVELLYALGYKKIGFVGCDSRYKDDDESNKDITIVADGNEYISHADTDINHFRPDYFGKGYHFGSPNPETIVKVWEEGSKRIPEDLELFSCTPDSAVNPWYEYIDFDEYIKNDTNNKIK